MIVPDRPFATRSVVPPPPTARATGLRHRLAGSSPTGAPGSAVQPARRDHKRDQHEAEAGCESAAGGSHREALVLAEGTFTSPPPASASGRPIALVRNLTAAFNALSSRSGR